MPLPEEGDMAHRLAETTGIYHVHHQNDATLQNEPGDIPGPLNLFSSLSHGNRGSPPSQGRCADQGYLDF